MRPNYPLSAFLSLLALAIVMLAAISFANQSADGQSSQPPFPAQLQRPDPTKPLADKNSPNDHEPTAAEMSQKETVASTLLRGLHYQEDEVRSAADVMPEGKSGYRRAES